MVCTARHELTYIVIPFYCLFWAWNAVCMELNHFTAALTTPVCHWVGPPALHPGGRRNYEHDAAHFKQSMRALSEPGLHLAEHAGIVRAWRERVTNTSEAARSCRF